MPHYITTSHQFIGLKLVYIVILRFTFEPVFGHSKWVAHFLVSMMANMIIRNWLKSNIKNICGISMYMWYFHNEECEGKAVRMYLFYVMCYVCCFTLC